MARSPLDRHKTEMSPGPHGRGFFRGFAMPLGCWAILMEMSSEDPRSASSVPSSDARQIRADAMRVRLEAVTLEALETVQPELKRLKPEPASERHRNHHFIPQFWLRKFEADGKVCVVDPSGEESPRLSGTSDEASVHDLYAMYADKADSGDEPTSEVTVVWEHILSVFENRAAPPFAQLVSADEKSKLTLKDIDRFWLSMLFAFQHVRVPEHLSNVRDFGNRLAQRFRMSLASLGNPRDWMTDEICQEAGIDPAQFAQLEWSPEGFWQGGELTVQIGPLSDIHSMLSLALEHPAVYSVFGRTWNLVRFPQRGLALSLKMGISLVHAHRQGILNSPGLATADQIWVPMSPNTLLVMHWKGDEYEPKNWTAEACAARLGLGGNAMICHPNDSQTLTRMWNALRNSRDEADALIRESSNVGTTLAVL